MTGVNRSQKDGSKKKVACPTAIADYTRSMGELLNLTTLNLPIAHVEDRRSGGI
ncbi:hypothetical protein NPIL_320181, partial [Nephila pilipes]